MSITERRQREKELVRTQILAAAWQLVKAEGWQSLSVRKIADLIEYSVPVVYDHFENKEAILFEISLSGFELLQKELKKAKQKHPNPGDQLKAMVDAYWKFAFKNKEYYQLMFGIGMPCSGKGQLKTEFSGFYNLFYESIVKIIQNKKSDVNEACLKSHALFSIMHGMASLVMIRNADIADTMNKPILDEIVTIFIRNL